jgi:di/tricarboxylate transporter
MLAFGVLTTEEAVRAIDIPTILLLYSLMGLSSQFRLGGLLYLDCYQNHAIHGKT